MTGPSCDNYIPLNLVEAIGELTATAHLLTPPAQQALWAVHAKVMAKGGDSLTPAEATWLAMVVAERMVLTLRAAFRGAASCV